MATETEGKTGSEFEEKSAAMKKQMMAAYDCQRCGTEWGTNNVPLGRIRSARLCLNCVQAYERWASADPIIEDEELTREIVAFRVAKAGAETTGEQLEEWHFDDRRAFRAIACRIDSWLAGEIS